MIRAEHIVDYYVGDRNFRYYLRYNKDFYKNLSREEKIKVRLELLDEVPQKAYTPQLNYRRSVFHSDLPLVVSGYFDIRKNGTFHVREKSNFFFHSVINCRPPCDRLKANEFTYKFLLANFVSWILESRGYICDEIKILVENNREYRVPYIPKLVKLMYEDYRRKFQDVL